MLLTRRLPGILYTYRCTAYSALILLATLVYFLFKWNLVCVNLQAWQHIKNICRLHEAGLAVGSLCAPLCLTEAIRSPTCRPSGGAFAAEWHDVRLVFKAPAAGAPAAGGAHWRDNGALRYPAEPQFLAAVRAVARARLNLTLAHDAAVRLARLKPSYEEKRKPLRQKEMDNLWLLLQDNEYLLSALFTDKDVFPQLLGTCGPYFAVEYLEPVQDISSFLLTESDNLENWGRRLRIALQILDLLEELESGFREPLHLCDVQLRHFGVAGRRRDGQRRLKLLDLDGVLPRSVAGALIAETTPACDADADCAFGDCRATCDGAARRCRGTVANDNWQTVCEKIFLGWRMSNRVIVPGLLMSRHTPADLAAILRQCADPERGEGAAKSGPDGEVTKRLYNVLSEIEQSVNNDFFLNNE